MKRRKIRAKMWMLIREVENRSEFRQVVGYTRHSLIKNAGCCTPGQWSVMRGCGLRAVRVEVREL